MASFESHPLFSSLRYQPAHALTLIQAGPRCRVCARLTENLRFEGRSGVGGGICDGCRPPHDTGLSKLINACCSLQNHFKLTCKSMPPARSWQPLFGMTACELWWWEMVNVFQLQCEHSLVVLAPLWEKLLYKGLWSALGGPIVAVCEMKIVPPLYWNYVHCAFAVLLVGDGWWVFDPTGVQFGPDWPLLSRFNDHVARTRSTIPSRQLYQGWRALGSNRTEERRERLDRSPF